MENYYSNQERSFYNPIRILQWLLCAICLVTAIILVINITSAISVLKIVLLLASASFFFITLIDIAVTSLQKPMLWTAWITFAFLAFLSFFLCVGFLIAQVHAHSSTVLYLWTLSIYVITGLIFLLDMINILKWLKNNKPPLFEKESYKTSECSTTSTPPQVASVIIMEETFVNDVSTSPYSEQSEPVMQKGNCGRENCKNRMYNSSAAPLSHGGTFHVSRDVAPILNSSICSNHCYQVAQNSYVRQSDMNKSRSSNYSLNRDSAFEVVSNNSRTVSTSVRTVSKQQQGESTLSCAGCPEQNENQYRHNSAPINPDHNRSVQHAYNCFCSRCGEVHKHVATVAPIISTNNCCGCKDMQSFRETVRGTSLDSRHPPSKYCCQKLPTLVECASETPLETYYSTHKEYKQNKKNIESSHMNLTSRMKSDHSVREIYKNEHDTESLSSVKPKRNKINQTNPFKQDMIENATSISNHSIPHCLCDKDILTDKNAIYFEVGDNKSIQSRSDWMLPPDILIQRSAELGTNNYYETDKKCILPGSVDNYKNESYCEMSPSPGCGSISINNPTSVTFKYVPREKCRCDFLKEVSTTCTNQEPPKSSTCQIL